MTTNEHSLREESEVEGVVEVERVAGVELEKVKVGGIQGWRVVMEGVGRRG